MNGIFGFSCCVALHVVSMRPDSQMFQYQRLIDQPGKSPIANEVQL